MFKSFRALARAAVFASAFYGLTTDFTQAQVLASWTQAGMLTCKLNPSIKLVIFGHQPMECQFTQNGRIPPQAYEGTLNTVGIDIGISGGGVLRWDVFAPTAGPPLGALAGEYAGATSEVGVGFDAGVLIGGSRGSFALQPVSADAVSVTVGISGLQLGSV